MTQGRFDPVHWLAQFRITPFKHADQRRLSHLLNAFASTAIDSDWIREEVHDSTVEFIGSSEQLSETELNILADFTEIVQSSNEARLERFTFPALSRTASEYFRDVTAADLRYLILKDIKEASGIVFGEEWLKVAFTLEQFSQSCQREESTSRCWKSLKDLATSIELEFRRLGTSVDSTALVRILVILGELRLGRPRPCEVEPSPGRQIQFKHSRIDAESFTNRIFGLPTAIKGLDTLFCGGLILGSVPDQSVIADGPSASPIQEVAPCRTTLILGGFGVGKSLLASLLSIEVVRKGGLAIVVVPEQGATEWKLALARLGIDLGSDLFNYRPFDMFAQSAYAPNDGKGLLLIASPQTTELDKVFRELRLFIEHIHGFGTKLLVVDPIDALASSAGPTRKIDDPEAPLTRHETRDLMRLAKKNHVNLLFTAEAHGESANVEHYIENTADTVIHLRQDSSDGLHRRSVEITKSRLQRQLPGRHAVLIGGRDTRDNSGVDVVFQRRGMRFYPSYPTLRVSIPKQVKKYSVPIHYGVRNLSLAIGSEDIRTGDIIVLGGPGRAKSRFGYEFLCPYLNTDGDGNLIREVDEDHTSLLITDRDAAFMKGRIRAFFSESADQRARYNNVEAWSIPLGNTDPGHILFDLYDAFEHFKRIGRPVDRLMIHSLSRWEEALPFVKKGGEAFAIEFVQLLRDYQVTTVAVASDSIEYGRSDAPIRNVFLDFGDAVFEFSRFEIRSVERTFFRVLRSSRMRHTKEHWELVSSSEGIRLEPPPFVNLLPSGETVPKQVRLFLFAETQHHKDINENMRKSIEVFYTSEVQLLTVPKMEVSFLNAGAISANNHVQLVQLDEYQAPLSLHHENDMIQVYKADSKRMSGLLGSRVKPIAEMLNSVAAATISEKRDLLVPLYLNISFLVVHETEWKLSFSSRTITDYTKSWRDIASLCSEYRSNQSTRSNKPSFFNCTTYGEASETLSCLFLEILQNLFIDEESGERTIPPSNATSGTIRLSDWMLVKGHEAAEIFRILMPTDGYTDLVSEHEGKGAFPATEQSGLREDALKRKPSPLFQRHWYNTYNQWQRDLANSSALSEYRPLPLPGDRTTAGEWYLAVPETSAFPYGAMQLVESMCSLEQEQLRLNQGVGLPTYQSFYTGEQGMLGNFSPFGGAVNFPVLRVYERALRRSQFKNYSKIAPTLGTYLKLLKDCSQNDVSVLMKNLRVAIAQIEETKSHAPKSA